MTVTRKDLKDYQNMVIALSVLDDEIEQSYNTYKSPSFNRTGGTSGKPSGQNSPQERALRKINRLEKDRDDLVQKMETIYNFVLSINDPEVCLICLKHYIDGYTWEATCAMIRHHHSKSVIIEKVNKYFNDHGIE